MISKIRGWKTSVLSHAGSLIKSSLASVPSSLWVNVYSLSKLSKAWMVQSEAFSGVSNRERHLYLRWWEDIKLPKNVGKFSFCDLHTKKLSLFLEQARKLMGEPELLYCKVIRAKYYNNKPIFEAQSQPIFNILERNYQMQVKPNLEHSGTW